MRALFFFCCTRYVCIQFLLLRSPIRTCNIVDRDNRDTGLVSPCCFCRSRSVFSLPPTIAFPLLPSPPSPPLPPLPFRSFRSAPLYSLSAALFIFLSLSLSPSPWLFPDSFFLVALPCLPLPGFLACCLRFPWPCRRRRTLRCASGRGSRTSASSTRG